MLTILKWYTIIILVINLFNALKEQLNSTLVPKGDFIINFIIMLPMLIYLFAS